MPEINLPAPGGSPNWAPKLNHAIEQINESADYSRWAVTGDASDKTYYVSTLGDNSNDGLTLKTAKGSISAAVSALNGPGVILVSAGTYTFSSTVSLPRGVTLQGAGTDITVLRYTGSGVAFTSATPGEHSYLWRVSNLSLVGPGASVEGSTGFHLDAMSTSSFSDVEVRRFQRGFRIYSPVSGYAVYNRFYNCNAQQNAIGWAIGGRGANANVFVGCRANLNTEYGVWIEDSNNNTFLSCQLESNTVGVMIRATSNAMADNNALINCRFESNTSQSWIVDNEFVRNAQITFPQIFGEYIFTDRGDKTQILGRQSATQAQYSTVARAEGSWRFERTVGGGDELPAFVVRDSNTSIGTPVVFQSMLDKTTGYFYRAVKDSKSFWDLDGQGNMRFPEGSYIEMFDRGGDSGPAPEGAVRLYVRNSSTTGQPALYARFATGNPILLARTPEE